MKYEETGSKTNKTTAKNARDNELKAIDTKTMVWHLIKRHKFGLVSAYAVALTVAYLFPFLPDMIKSIFVK